MNDNSTPVHTDETETVRARKGPPKKLYICAASSCICEVRLPTSCMSLHRGFAEYFVECQYAKSKNEYFVQCELTSRINVAVS